MVPPHGRRYAFGWEVVFYGDESPDYRTLNLQLCKSYCSCPIHRALEVVFYGDESPDYRTLNLQLCKSYVTRKLVQYTSFKFFNQGTSLNSMEVKMDSFNALNKKPIEHIWDSRLIRSYAILLTIEVLRNYQK